MKYLSTFVLVVVLTGFEALAVAAAPGDVSGGAPRPKHLRHFSSKKELNAFLTKLRRKRGKGSGYGTADGQDGSPSGTSATVNVTAGGGGGGAEQQEVITNTQEAGVDEGGIVKLHGNFLVILRRGRLFTVDISKNGIKPVSTVNAYGPDINPEDTWYDEMLISGENVVVIGYSYDRGGTEIGLFTINDGGRLSYRSTYHLRSNDYYSSRNYSSRLIGSKLIFYSPLDLDLDAKDSYDSFPAVRRWHKGAKPAEFHRIAGAADVYIPERFQPQPDEVTLHTVTTCDISEDMSCTAKSVIGPSGNVFYVSSRNVYVWASTWAEDESKERNRSYLFKMPLDGDAPSSIRVSGSPIDQFSFKEDEDGAVAVLVQAGSTGDGMWGAEVTEGEVALLRLLPNDFDNGSKAAPRHAYQTLDEPGGYSVHDRFIGDWLLYGAETPYSAKDPDVAKKLFVLNCRTGVLTSVRLDHDVERLDLLGSDGIVVGTMGDDLSFTSIKLDGSPRVVDSYLIRHASQGETRSQGFFYKPSDDTSGLLGLPIVRGNQSGEGYAASVAFLRNKDLRFASIGELASTPGLSVDDDCKASCFDWYGDARPIFAKGRIFALLGYELVEGGLADQGLSEVRRSDLTPVQSKAQR